MFTNTLSLNYQSKVAIPFGQLQSVIDWCYKNCEKNWNYTDYMYDINSKKWLADEYLTGIFSDLTMDYVFSFESEKDYIAFILVHE